MMVQSGDEDTEQVTSVAEGGEEVSGDDQDDLAAEWESMVGTDDDSLPDMAADASQETTRVLNQDEIDSLLGGDEEGVHGAPEGAHQPRLQGPARATERDQSGVMSHIVISWEKE